ncbi:MAG: hypothetical protein MZV63_20450 [Marinilabiliales bacterium]|nr:hypothetical protein [Marinilabiliales bacterium]
MPDAPTAAIFMQMGADFIVSPVFNPEVARICNRRKVLWIPGCGTLTEISEAEELGAEIVKIFPGNCRRRTLIREGGQRPMPVDEHHAHRRRRSFRGKP